MKIIQIKRREDMQRVKLYGIQSASVLRVYKESVYFYRLCDAMEVCQHLNNQEQNKRLNRTYLPFSTTLQTLEHHTRLVDNDRFRDDCEKSQLRRQLGIKNYRVFESSNEYFASTSASTLEESPELVMN